MSELVEGGVGFSRMLVSALRKGHLILHRERRQVRTVTRVESLTRLHLEPMEGEPDHLDFPQHGFEAMQWVNKGKVTSFGPTRSQADLEASWEQRDANAADGRPLY